MKLFSNRRFRLIVTVIAWLNLVATIRLMFARPRWGYSDGIGPSDWGNICPEFSPCGAGKAQSPIDITDATAQPLTSIDFNYSAAPLAIFNNSHTIEVEYGAGSITYAGTVYNAVQFHFHQPGEHTINGESFPMELHIVHSNEAGDELAVIGIMIAEGEAENTAFAPIFDHLPASECPPDRDTQITVNAADLLPSDAEHFYTYGGSLTTPPCTENVRWLVMAQPIELSAAQIAAFGAIYCDNARPTQPRNTRDLFTNGG